MDSYLGFFRAYSIFLSCLGTVTTVGGGVYFLWWKKRQLDLVRKSSVMEEDGEGIRGEIVVNLGGGGVGDEKKK